jgi:hypothetical protein
MNYFTFGGMSFLSKFMIDLMKSSRLSQVLMSFHSGFEACFDISAMTGSRASFTAGGGVA